MNTSTPARNLGSVSSVSSFGSPPTSSGSMLENLGAIMTSWQGVVGVILVVMILIFIYYQTVGYSLDLGWNKMKWSHDNDEKIKIEVPGTKISAELKPITKNQPASAAIDGPIQRIETDVQNALGLGDGGKQVFNVARNLYKFEEAEPLCKAFGAELATYDQVKKAYKAGADWCNYGWSKGQLALFPTQKETYEKLQHGPESQRMSCGLTGVNGGFFPNADQRFGVNCYGARPEKSALDERIQEADSSDIAFDREVNRFKSELDSIPVNPFASGRWSA